MLISNGYSLYSNDNCCQKGKERERRKAGRGGPALHGNCSGSVQAHAVVLSCRFCHQKFKIPVTQLGTSCYGFKDV